MVGHTLFTLRLFIFFFYKKATKSTKLPRLSYFTSLIRSAVWERWTPEEVSMVCLLISGNMLDVLSVSSLANHVIHSEDLSASPRSRKIDSIH